MAQQPNTLETNANGATYTEHHDHSHGPFYTTRHSPPDIVDVASFLGWMKSELPDSMVDAVIEWRDDLRAAVKEWRNDPNPDAKEPDWKSFRESCNEMCAEDGYPLLFKTEEV